MRFCIPDILDKSNSIIPDKINTHSRKGFTIYLNKFLVNEYNSICLIQNCYVCSKIIVLTCNTQCILDAGPVQLFLTSVFVIRFVVCIISMHIFILWLFFALIHRLYSNLSASPSALMVLFYDCSSFHLSVFPVT